MWEMESAGRSRRLPRILSLFEVPQSGIEEISSVSLNQPVPATDGRDGLVTGAVDVLSTAPGRGLDIKEEQETSRHPFSPISAEHPTSLPFVELAICPPAASEE